MKKTSKYLVIVLIIVFLVGCEGNNNSNHKVNNEEQTEKIEAYKAKTVSHEEGDYKLVNSQILMYGSGENLKVEARLIEDLYDRDGNYIKTRLLHSTTQNGDEEAIIDEHQTILLSEQFDENEQMAKELTKQEENDIKQHILEVFKNNF
jgi:PBP1b-binding outer membrane lipoprotein LpoB